MTIAFSCPACLKKIEVPGELAGRKAKCKGCGGPLLIPTPRVAPQAVSTRREEPEDPYDLGEADAVDEPTDLYADDVDDSPALPTVSRGAKSVKKPKDAARRRPEGPRLDDAPKRIVYGVLGVASLALGLLLVEGITTTLLRFGLVPFSGRGAYYVVVITVVSLYGAINGVAKMLPVFLPRTSEDGLKTGLGVVVAALAVAVGGLRMSRGPEPRTMLAAMLGWDGGAREGGGQEGPNIMSLATPELLARLRSPDMETRRRASNILNVRQPNPNDPREEVRSALKAMLAARDSGERLSAVSSLSLWGTREDLGALQAMRNDPEPKVAQEAMSTIARIEAGP